MIMKCKNPKCLNEWDYKGSSKFYATCSLCKSSIKVIPKTKTEIDRKELKRKIRELNKLKKEIKDLTKSVEKSEVSQ